jgi:hypothetical protein
MHRTFVEMLRDGVCLTNLVSIISSVKHCQNVLLALSGRGQAQLPGVGLTNQYIFYQIPVYIYIYRERERGFTGPKWREIKTAVPQKRSHYIYNAGDKRLNACMYQNQERKYCTFTGS